MPDVTVSYGTSHDFVAIFKNFHATLFIYITSQALPQTDKKVQLYVYSSKIIQHKLQ